MFNLILQLTDKILFQEIHRELENIDISLLECFGISTWARGVLLRNGIRKIKDLSCMSFHKLFNLIKINAEKLGTLENALKKSVLSLFKDITNSGKNKRYDILLFRASGFTLQETGESFGISRERVRQIIRQIMQRLDVKILMKSIVIPFLEEKGFATVQELLDVSDDDDFDKILIYWCKHSGIYNYVDYADVFLDNNVKQFDKSALLNFAANIIGEGTDLNNHVDEIEAYFNEQKITYLNLQGFIEFLLQNGYRLYKNFIVHGEKSYGYLCARVIGKYYPEGIKLYDHETLNELRKLVTDEYGDIGISENDWAFSARIKDSTVLSGRGVVTAEENIHVDVSLIESIKDYIDDAPDREIYYSELYSKFEGMLSMMSNIDNYNFLHGVLKLYYPHEYNYSQRDYLTKIGGGLKTGKLADKINNYIIKMGKPVHKKELKQEFGCSDIVIINALSGNSKLFQWDYNYYFSLDLISLNEEIIDKLRKCICSVMDNTEGYCSDALLLEDVRKDDSEFLRNNNLKNNYNLFSLCAKLFNTEFDFRRPHIVCKNTMKNISTRDIALKALGNTTEIDFRKYQSIVKIYKWSTVTAGMVFQNIEKKYIRVSEYIYHKIEDFHISSDALAKIKEVLMEKIQIGYLTLMNFDDWVCFPDIDYTWNVFLLRAIIEKFLPTLKIIETRYTDRRYERGIVVESTSPLNTYEDVVVYFMKSNNICEAGENKMLSLLVNNNLAYKILSKELYDGEKLIYKDEKFVLTI